MNMFARFDENPAMTLQDIKETKRYGQTEAHTHAHTHTRTHTHTDNVKTVYPPQTKFAGGINNGIDLTAPICRQVWAFVVRMQQSQVFSQDPFYSIILKEAKLWYLSLNTHLTLTLPVPQS